MFGRYKKLKYVQIKDVMKKIINNYFYKTKHFFKDLNQIRRAELLQNQQESFFCDGIPTDKLDVLTVLDIFKKYMCNWLTSIFSGIKKTKNLRFFTYLLI